MQHMTFHTSMACGELWKWIYKNDTIFNVLGEWHGISDNSPNRHDK